MKICEFWIENEAEYNKLLERLKKTKELLNCNELKVAPYISKVINENI